MFAFVAVVLVDVIAFEVDTMLVDGDGDFVTCTLVTLVLFFNGVTEVVARDGAVLACTLGTLALLFCVDVLDVGGSGIGATWLRALAILRRAFLVSFPISKEGMMFDISGFANIVVMSVAAWRK